MNKCVKCGTKLTNDNWHKAKKDRHFLCDCCYKEMHNK